MLTIRQVTPATPEFVGKYYLTSNISPANPFYPTVEAKAGTGNYLSMGGGRVVAAMRLGDRSYYTFAGLELPETWRKDNSGLINNPAKLRQTLAKDHFADWPAVSTDLITQSDGDFYVWPLYGVNAEAMEWQTVSGVTLIGDAAHLW